MSQLFEQFLGSSPGLLVELVHSTTSPYVVKTSEGFEFIISSEDFNNFYRPLGDKTPARFSNLITEPETGLVNTQVIVPIIEMIRHFVPAFHDFTRARSFLRWSAKQIADQSADYVNKARKKIDREARSPHLISDEDLARVATLGPKAIALLISDTCAEILWPVGKSSEQETAAQGIEPELRSEKSRKPKPEKPVKSSMPRMKNVELVFDKDMLTVMVDLTKDFGPSKSGRNNLVATTEGNKTLPGRDERIGMTVYREIEPKVVKRGAKDSFKNLRMQVEGDTLTIFIDLTQEVGPSKSGKNIIISSSGGNQLVFTRQEKIGLNVYRPL